MRITLATREDVEITANRWYVMRFLSCAVGYFQWTGQAVQTERFGQDFQFHPATLLKLLVRDRPVLVPDFNIESITEVP